jgi:hypothetical protein
MNCPNEITDAITGILRMGIARIQVFGAKGDGSRCFIEADHLHNLPHVLTSYSPGALRYYLEVEVPIFVRESKGISIVDFEKYWHELKKYLNCL